MKPKGISSWKQSKPIQRNKPFKPVTPTAHFPLPFNNPVAHLLQTGLKGQQHPSSHCPQQTFQSPPQDVKLCPSRCAWGVITMRKQKLCFGPCIWPCLLRQTSWSDYLAVHTHSRPDWNRWKSQRKLSFEKFLFPWHPCQDVENEENEQQLAAPASKPGFGYWQWVTGLWMQSSGDSQS